jgi:predicted transcriptional regulator
MSTTTLKLPEELKKRVAAVARVSGKSSHAFMVDAIEQQAHLAELRLNFMKDALAAQADAHKSRSGYAAAEVHRYMSARAKGKTPARPKSRTWRK